MKEDYQKALKKLTFFLLWNPVLFDGQDYEKHKGSTTSDQLLFRLKTSSENSFISDVLPDQV